MSTSQLTNFQSLRSDAGESIMDPSGDLLDSSNWSALREMPAWAISLIVHLLLLIGLASLTMIVNVEPEMSLTTMIEDEVENEEFKFDPTVVDQVGSDSTANMASPSLAAAQQLGQDPHEEMQEKLEEKLKFKEPVVASLPEPNQAELLETFDSTGATEHTGGTEGAIDRLSLEIAGSLREGKTMVGWLFDASLSLKDRRDAIADRFEGVHKQLKVMNATGGEALKTAVATFGAETKFLTNEPTSDYEQLAKLIRGIENDTTGKENVFGAVDGVFRKWESYRRKTRRRMMMIIVTDERGDDYALLEDVINKLRRSGTRVFCVGNAAVFGREKGYIEFTWTADGEEFTKELPVDQGPETVAPERLRLPFWTANNRRLERMSAGYGPYALTRLCAETGGLYLVAEDSLGRSFPYEVMRNYLPDYRPIRDYEQQLRSNLAKGALVQAAMKTKVDNVPAPQLRFQANTDNVLRQQITEAQKPLADLEYHLRTMHDMLAQGEKDRKKLDTPRWKASFDLAMGRVLAMRVRAHGYNAVLAEMKSTPKSFSKDGSNMWRLVPSKNVDAGPTVKKLKKSAEEYLTRVIDEHPDTPWAMLAETELGDPLGWEWQEGSMPIMAQNGQGANGNNVQLANDPEARRRQERARKMRATEPSL